MSSTTADRPKILVIEDEGDLRQVLVHGLTAEGYHVRWAESGEVGLAEVAAFEPDLVLLDLMLAGTSGVEVCRRIRADGPRKQPIIVIVTAKGDEIDRVVGFEVGADDYVVKPFSVRELMLRVRAHLRHLARREGAEPASEEPQRPRRIHAVGPLTIDLDTHRVLVNDREVPVSVLEVRLLAYLAEAEGYVCSRRDLLTHVWRYSPDVTSRTVDTHVKRLRDKLGSAGALIQTVRGVGYRLAGSDGRRGQRSAAGPAR